MEGKVGKREQKKDFRGKMQEEEERSENEKKVAVEFEDLFLECGGLREQGQELLEGAGEMGHYEFVGDISG